MGFCGGKAPCFAGALVDSDGRQGSFAAQQTCSAFCSSFCAQALVVAGRGEFSCVQGAGL